MSIRKGAPKAIIALAHHMIVVVHRILTRKEEYVELGGDYYDQKNKPRTVARLVERLHALGYEVDLRTVPSTPVAPGDTEATGTISSEPIQCRRNESEAGASAQRGMICKQGTSWEVNSLIPPTVEGERFS